MKLILGLTFLLVCTSALAEEPKHLVIPSPKDVGQEQKNEDLNAEESSKGQRKVRTQNKEKYKEYEYDEPIFTQVIPPGFESLMIYGETFYYKDGIFYQIQNDHLIPVNAPIGAVVDYIPTSRREETINEITYYIYNGVYYVMTPHGHFQVVEPLPTTVTVSH
jgi:hypothetical protein